MLSKTLFNVYRVRFVILILLEAEPPPTVCLIINLKLRIWFYDRTLLLTSSQLYFWPIGCVLWSSWWFLFNKILLKFDAFTEMLNLYLDQIT